MFLSLLCCLPPRSRNPLLEVPCVLQKLLTNSKRSLKSLRYLNYLPIRKSLCFSIYTAAAHKLVIVVILVVFVVTTLFLACKSVSSINIILLLQEKLWTTIAQPLRLKDLSVLYFVDPRSKYVFLSS
jgi:hypothetical protein